MRRLTLLSSALCLCGWAHIRVEGEADKPAFHFSRDYVIPIHTHSAGYSELDFGPVRGAIEAALTTWVLDDLTVSFVRDPNGRDGDTPAMDGVNVVRFEEQRLPREVDPDTVLAFTSHVAVSCTGVIAETDITFNGVTATWSTSPRG